MIIQETYRFIEKNFDKAGINCYTVLSFIEQINIFERDFFEKYPFTPVNSIFINIIGMQLIKRCHFDEDYEEFESEIYGQDIIYDDLEANFDVNSEMDSASSKTLIYAISTALDEDKPLFLFQDNQQPSNSLTLKYISGLDDDDEDDDEEITISPLDEVLVNQ